MRHLYTNSIPKIIIKNKYTKVKQTNRQKKKCKKFPTTTEISQKFITAMSSLDRARTPALSCSSRIANSVQVISVIMKRTLKRNKRNRENWISSLASPRKAAITTAALRARMKTNVSTWHPHLSRPPKMPKAVALPQLRETPYSVRGSRRTKSFTSKPARNLSPSSVQSTTPISHQTMPTSSMIES